ALRGDSERPNGCRATKKYDKFPSPHGFARAEDYIGYQKQYHFLGREVRRSLHQRPALMSALGQKQTFCTAAQISQLSTIALAGGPKIIRQVISVGQQAGGFGEDTVWIHGRETVADRQRCNLGERRIKIVLAAGSERRNLQPHSARSLLPLFYLIRGTGI